MTRSRARRLPRHDGFTLVELLVVISIISLLMAILLPALAQARAQAVILRCMSLHRDLALSSVQYTTDNRDWFPINQYYRSVNSSGTTQPSATDQLLAWNFHFLAPYLNIPETSTYAPELIDQNHARNFFCPAENERGNNARYSIESSFGRIYTGSSNPGGTLGVVNVYNVNANYGRQLSGFRITQIGIRKGVPPTFNFANGNYAQLTYIPWYFTPRNTPMYWDGRFAADPGNYFTAANFDKDFPSHNLGRRSGARFNLAFADGSARTMGSNYNPNFPSFRDNSWYPEWWKN